MLIRIPAGLQEAGEQRADSVIHAGATSGAFGMSPRVRHNPEPPLTARAHILSLSLPPRSGVGRMRHGLQLKREEFDELVEQNHEDVIRRLEKLDERIDALEIHFEAEKDRIHKEVDRRRKDLELMLKDFKQHFEDEKASRARREKKIQEKMKQHEEKIDVNFSTEKDAREQCVPLSKHSDFIVVPSHLFSALPLQVRCHAGEDPEALHRVAKNIRPALRCLYLSGVGRRGEKDCRRAGSARERRRRDRACSQRVGW